MSVLDIFRPLKKMMIQRFKELGTYQATFSVFGNDPYGSSVVRSCIRPLADFSSKAMAQCPDEMMSRILNYRPNQYMNGHDFLYKIRTRLELLNTAFIYMERDNKGKIIGFYPVPYSYFEAVEYRNGLFIRFYFSGDAARELVLPWEDLCVLRKDYCNSDISGDDNGAIIKTLELLNTTDEGLANSIKATANLRGILQSTKAMLAPEAIKKMKDEFVSDYMNLSNSGGIAALDSTSSFTPIKMEPSTASFEQRKDIREDIYRYFGVNDKIIMSDISTEELENFYKIRIEPFYIELSQELTSKVYPGRAGAYEKNKITYMAETGQFMTMSQKIEMFNKVVLYGGMLIDEWRALIGLGHIDGGDSPIRRLDAAEINSPKATGEDVTVSDVSDEEEEDGSEE